MLIGTYQERPIGFEGAHYPKIDGIDFPAIWAIPLSNLLDSLTESIITAPNMPLFFLVYDVEPSDVIRIDTRKRSYQIAHDLPISNIIDNSLPDRYSELIVNVNTLKEKQPFDVCQISLLAQKDSISKDNANTEDLKDEMNNLNSIGLTDLSFLLRASGIPEELDEYFHEVLEEFPLLPFDYNHALPGNLSDKPTTRSIYFAAQSAKKRFEYVLLPFFLKLWFQTINLHQPTAIQIASDDFLPIMANWGNVLKADSAFASWVNGNADPSEFDHYYDAIRNKIVDNDAVAEALFYHDPISPNDPCPCGSGKKWKKCHWRKLA